MNRGFGFNGFGFNRPVRGSVVPPVSYSAEATAYFARMSVQPDGTRKSQLDTLITGLKSDGILAKLEGLWIMAAHDAQAARLNVISTSFNLTANNSPTFTTDRGYAGNASTSYLSTGLIPSASSLVTQNSATLFTWLNAGGDTASSGAVSIGCLDASYGLFIIPRGASDLVRGRMNRSTTTNYTGATATTRYGLTAVTRTGSTTVEARHNTTSGSGTNGSEGRPTNEIYICGLNNLGVIDLAINNRIAVAGVGSGLNGTELTALYDRLNTYLTALGAT